MPVMMLKICWRLLLCDESACALLGFEQAADFHLAVGAGDRVGVDGEIDGYLADGGELVAGLQPSDSDRTLDLIHELPIDGHAAVRVQMKTEFVVRFWGSSAHAVD